MSRTATFYNIIPCPIQFYIMRVTTQFHNINFNLNKKIRTSLVSSRSLVSPHSPLVGRVLNSEGARLLFRCVLDNPAVVRSPLLGAGVLGRWGFLFLNQFSCVSIQEDKRVRSSKNKASQLCKVF